MGRLGATRIVGLVLAVAFSIGCASSETKKKRHFEEGNQYAAKGDYPQAIIEYRNAIQLDPKFGQARYRLALAYEQTGDSSQAFREILRAAELLRDDEEVQRHAADWEIQAGQYEDAAARARGLIARHPKSVDAFVLLGKASAGLKNSDSALGQLEEAIRQLPPDPRLQQTVGELERSRGNRAAAESAFKRAISLSPKSAEPRQALALYYFSVGRAADAEATLKDARGLETSGSPIERDLAILYFLQGRDKEAEREIREVLAASPNDVPFRVALGDLYSRNRRFDDAIKTYTPLIENQKTFGSASARVAFDEYENGKKDAAHERLAQAIRRAPKDADLRTMSARLLLADGKFRDAELAAKAALEVEPERFEPLYVLGTAAIEQAKMDEALPSLRRAAAVAPRAVGPKIQLGRLYLELGDAKTALEFAKDAVALAPRQPLAQLLLVRAYVAARDVANADIASRFMLEHYPNSPQTQSAAGSVAMLKNNLPGARRSYAKALELDPASSEALSGMILIELNSKRVNEALALANRSVAEHPTDIHLLTVAARAYLAAHDPKRAEDELQQAIKLSANSSSSEAYSMLAGLYFRDGRLGEAKTQFETLMRRQPSAIGPPTMLGIILQLQGKPKEAQTVYERVVQTNANAAVANNNLAMLLADSGENLDVALNHAQAAKRVSPQDPAVDDTLGWVYYKKGLSASAIASFKQCVTNQPGNPIYSYHLGLAYAQNGDKDKARQSLESALKLQADFDGADEARKVLKSIVG